METAQKNHRGRRFLTSGLVSQWSSLIRRNTDWSESKKNILVANAISNKKRNKRRANCTRECKIILGFFNLLKCSKKTSFLFKQPTTVVSL